MNKTRPPDIDWVVLMIDSLQSELGLYCVSTSRDYNELIVNSDIENKLQLAFDEFHNEIQPSLDNKQIVESALDYLHNMLLTVRRIEDSKNYLYPANLYIWFAVFITP